MKIKSPQEIAIMREGGRRLSAILQQVAALVAPGVSTEELDRKAKEMIFSGRDIPAFLNYKPDFSSKPYPATICASINDEVVHGLPGGRVLRLGDIVGLDLGLAHGGLVVDMAVTVPVGEINENDKKLINTTKQALAEALGVVRAGLPVNEIGKAIERVVHPAGFSIVEELGGHGVGEKVHEPPFIPHFAGTGGKEKLEAGQTIAIEPMINAGGKGVTFDKRDGYTVRTADGSRSAHFEVTLAVTPTGPDVLTPIFW